MLQKDYIDINIAEIITLPKIDMKELTTLESILKKKYSKDTNVVKYYNAAKKAADLKDLDLKNKFLWYTFVLICRDDEIHIFNSIQEGFKNNSKKDKNYRQYLVPYAKEWLDKYQSRSKIKERNIHLEKRHDKKFSRKKKNNKRVTGRDRIQSPRSSIRHSV